MRHQLLAVLTHTLSILNTLCPRCQTFYDAAEPQDSYPHRNKMCTKA